MSQKVIRLQATVIVHMDFHEEDFEGSGETYEHFVEDMKRNNEHARGTLVSNLLDLGDILSEDVIKQVGNKETEIVLKEGTLVYEEGDYIIGKFKEG